jgi:hypothetical protein
MRVCIELRSNNASKTFIRFSSEACNIVEIGSPALSFVDPKLDLRSRECILPMIIPEIGNDFEPWHAFISAEFNDVPLFDFHICDSLSPIDTLLPASFS